jgi:hypothetical protein
LASNSLNEGFRVYVAYSPTDLYASIIGDVSENDGYITHSSLDALADIDSLETPQNIYAMASVAKLEQNSMISSYAIQDNHINVYLDGVYSSITNGDVVIIEYDGSVAAKVVDAAGTDKRKISDDQMENVEVLVSRITLGSAGLPMVEAEDAVRIWFDARKAGTLERIPTKTVQTSDILNQYLPLTNATDTTNLPITKTDIVIEDAEGTALLAKGDIYLINGTPKAHITEISPPNFSDELAKPITFHWGLTKVTRGETVKREVLGSGDATQIFQTFKLAKSPLTYVSDPAAPNGRRAELKVYVNGVEWRKVQSFYGAQAGDEIYTIKHDEDHETYVIFGDGELGSRLPTGANNVVATYRFGVGGNVDAGEINRLKRPVKGVKSVINPLPATGGEDPPSPEEARVRAIQSTRVLGKLVSLPDFEVEAARYGGVLQAKAEWAWDRTLEDAVAKVWIVAPGVGDPSPDLQAYLRARAEPGTLVRVQKLQPWNASLLVDLEIDPAYLPEEVRAAVDARLWDDFSGLLAPRNIPIGRPLFRSRVYAAIHEIDGVIAVTGLSFGGEQMWPAVTVPETYYLALTKYDPNVFLF